jgi:hypothetical protein
MVSDRKRAANLRNAAKDTGPRLVMGKQHAGPQCPHPWPHGLFPMQNRAAA